LAHDRCYAGPLKDCSNKISREHYISKNLLQSLGVTISVSGLKFLDGERSLPAQALTAKILCERHNRPLSPLDREAGRLFKSLRDMDAGLRTSVRKPTSEQVIINGADIERWCLKALAGLAMGGTVTSDAFEPGAPWVEILFGARMWPAGWGLHIFPRSDVQYAFAGVEIEVLIHPQEGWVLAGTFDVAGLRLLLSLGQSNQSMFRPAGVHFRRLGSSAVKTMTFSWPRPPEHSYIEMTRSAEYDGPRPIDSPIT
jgi:hypothetical protein